MQEQVCYVVCLQRTGGHFQRLQGYGVSLRLRYAPSVQVSSKAEDTVATMGSVGVLTLRGAAAGACGDLPQLLLPQPLGSVSFQDSAVLPQESSVQLSFHIIWHD